MLLKKGQGLRHCNFEIIYKIAWLALANTIHHKLKHVIDKTDYIPNL